MSVLADLACDFAATWWGNAKHDAMQIARRELGIDVEGTARTLVERSQAARLSRALAVVQQASPAPTAPVSTALIRAPRVVILSRSEVALLQIRGWRVLRVKR